MFQTAFCYPTEWDHQNVQTRLERLATFGFDGIEFWDRDLQAIDAAVLAEMLETAGLRCAQICPYFDFVHGQEAWDKSMRIGERYVAWARTLGNPLIRVFTGGGVGPADASQQQWDAAATGLQRICDMAAPHGIRLALECHTGSLMEDSPNALRLLEVVGRENLGVNLQLPLKGGREPIEVSIRELGRHTWHMHAHNYTALLGGRLLPLGEGVLDYEAIMAALVKEGFDGYVSIEHPSHEGTRDPWEIAEIEGRYLAQLRDRLREKLLR